MRRRCSRPPMRTNNRRHGTRSTRRCRGRERIAQPAALAPQREGDMHGKGGATLVLGKPRWRGRGRALVVLSLMACLLLGWGHSATAQPKPAGEMRWALYVTFPPA